MGAVSAQSFRQSGRAHRSRRSPNPRLMREAPLTPEERRFVQTFRARYRAMQEWEIAYVVRKTLDLLEKKRCQNFR